MSFRVQFYVPLCGLTATYTHSWTPAANVALYAVSRDASTGFFHCAIQPTSLPTDLGFDGSVFNVTIYVAFRCCWILAPSMAAKLLLTLLTDLRWMKARRQTPMCHQHACLNEPEPSNPIVANGYQFTLWSIRTSTGKFLRTTTTTIEHPVQVSAQLRLDLEISYQRNAATHNALL